MSMTPDYAELLCAAGLPTTSFDERLKAARSDDQRLYRVLLQFLAAQGAAPSMPAAATTAGLTEDQVGSALHRLASADLVALDASGDLVGVFPLSARPTRHRVTLPNGRELHAMCAVDALGVPAMVGQPGTIHSSDPSTGGAICVEISDQTVVAEPAETVVLLCRSGAGPLASACCSVIDFYASADGAQAALEEFTVAGQVLQLANALDLGVELFARLPANPMPEQE